MSCVTGCFHYWVEGALEEGVWEHALLAWAHRRLSLPLWPLLQRALSRTAFKQVLADHQGVRLDIARSRLELDAARWVGGCWVAQSQSGCRRPLRWILGACWPHRVMWA